MGNLQQKAIGYSEKNQKLQKWIAFKETPGPPIRTYLQFKINVYFSANVILVEKVEETKKVFEENAIQIVTVEKGSA